MLAPTLAPRKLVSRANVRMTAYRTSSGSRGPVTNARSTRRLPGWVDGALGRIEADQRHIDPAGTSGGREAGWVRGYSSDVPSS
jgi:hypothetical protein